MISSRKTPTVSKALAADVKLMPCRVTSQIVGGLSTHEQSCSVSPQGIRLRLQTLLRGSNSSSRQHSGLTFSSTEEAFKGRHNCPPSYQVKMSVLQAPEAKRKQLLSAVIPKLGHQNLGSSCEDTDCWLPPTPKGF